MTRRICGRAALRCASLALLVMSCSHEAPEEVESQTPVSVRVQAASRGSIRGVIRATGQGLPEHWRKENIWRENNVWGAGGATGGSST